MGEGATPLVPGDDPDTWFKLEFASPTGSFKDRGAAVLVAVATTLGARSLVADSSGNAGTAVAAYAARMGLPCTVFVPGGTSDKKLRQMSAHGAEVVAHGTRADAAAAAVAHVDATGSFYASHVYSPFFFEGTKTYLFEILEQMRRVPDRLVLPVGNGTLVLGVVRALDELEAAGLIRNRPELLLVQAAACAPIADTLASAAPTHTVDRGTIAEGIAIADPPRGPQLLEIAQRPGTRVVSVHDETIAAAVTWLAGHGLYVEPTAGAALAGLWEARRSTWASPDQLTVVPLTGSGLKTFTTQ